MRLPRLLTIAMGLVTVSGAGSALAQDGSDGSQARPRINFRLSGGAGFPAIGKLNDALEAYDDWYEGVVDSRVEGATGPMGIEKELSAEVVVNATSQLGITLGFGMTTSKGGGDVGETYNGPNWTVEYLDRLEDWLRVLPLEVGVRFGVPLTQRVRGTLAAGLGYYRARLEETIIYTVDSEAGWNITSLRDFSATGSTLGFHGGAGLEARINRTVSVFVEGTYRRAKVRPLEGDYSEDYSVTETNGPGEHRYEQGSGTLYYFEYQMYPWERDTPWTPAVGMSEREPVEYPTADYPSGQSAIEELQVDLSGVSLEVGLSFAF